MTHIHPYANKLRQILTSGKMLYFLIMLMLASETTAMGYLKNYSLSGHILLLATGVGFYFLMDLFLVGSLQFEEMGIVNTLSSAFSVMIVVITGVVLFHEKVSGIEMIGIALVVSGAIILRSKKSTLKQKTRGGHCLHVSAHEIPPRS